ncbi:MAG TPA: HNH endonuclease signature motif containing protein [Ktedonobacterales bacterium]|nr:HNH endonuclease signature motif containing protein [Ktedonobacterales bacterium]
MTVTSRDVARFARRSRYDKKAGALFSRAKRLHGGRPNGFISGRQLYGLWLAQDGRCAYCGEKFPERFMTVDHIIPLSRPGGVNAVWNACWACKRCNSQKQDRTADEYLAWLAAKQQAA